MPVPLVPVVVGAVIAAGGVSVLVAQLKGQRPVAILGGPGVGKTALLRVLSGTPDDRMESGITFELKVRDKTKRFRVARDVPGVDALGYPEWHRAFRASTYVWYLFRADLIAAGDEAEVSRVREHLDMLRTWLPHKHHKEFILIGTWADVAGRSHGEMAELANEVRKSDALRLGALKLGNAPIIVESLQDQKSADRLMKRVAEAVG